MRQLAMVLGVEPPTVMAWNQGRNRPKMETLLKLCQLFYCQLHELVDPPLHYQELLNDDSPYSIKPFDDLLY
jgi:DNA-binding XRE family transcriptional regulator